MGVRNVVLMFILVWTSTAADDDFSVSCDEVTGIVRKEVTFTCSLSSKNSGFCITFYKFHYLQKYTDSDICRVEFPPDPCEQRNSFTCSFSPTTVMTGAFKFFVQIKSGWKYTEITVNITEPRKPEITEAPDINAQRDILTTVESPGTENGFGSKSTVISAVTGCFIFIIFIIIIMTIIYKKKPNYIQSCGSQRMFLCHKHDDNNSNFQEQNPEDVL